MMLHLELKKTINRAYLVADKYRVYIHPDKERCRVTYESVSHTLAKVRYLDLMYYMCNGKMPLFDLAEVIESVCTIPQMYSYDVKDTKCSSIGVHDREDKGVYTLEEINRIKDARAINEQLGVKIALFPMPVMPAIDRGEEVYTILTELPDKAICNLPKLDCLVEHDSDIVGNFKGGYVIKTVEGIPDDWPSKIRPFTIEGNSNVMWHVRRNVTEVEMRTYMDVYKKFNRATDRFKEASIAAFRIGCIDSKTGNPRFKFMIGCYEKDVELGSMITLWTWSAIGNEFREVFCYDGPTGSELDYDENVECIPEMVTTWARSGFAKIKNKMPIAVRCRKLVWLVEVLSSGLVPECAIYDGPVNNTIDGCIKRRLLSFIELICVDDQVSYVAFVTKSSPENICVVMQDERLGVIDGTYRILIY